MNKWIKIITSLMIVILIALLILIFLNYINNREIINIINSNSIHTSGDNTDSKPDLTNETNIQPIENTNNLIIENLDETQEENNEVIVPSGEINENNSNEENNIQTNTISKEDKTTKNNKSTNYDKNASADTSIQKDSNQKETNAVITSNVDTSNEEKRQVLNELDSALKGLLDVVSKVPTVDEEKLDASLKESEVSP